MPKTSTLAKADDLIARYPALSVCRDDLIEAVKAICESYAGGHKLISCGNGGSASDAEHIVGELMKGFLLPRKLGPDMEAKMRAVCPEEADYFMENLQGTLPALSMVNQVALNTAFANDQAPDLSFAQQLLGMGDAGDVLLDERHLRPADGQGQGRPHDCSDGQDGRQDQEPRPRGHHDLCAGR